ncbi:hypothetical protein [uncultured Psychrosphaera sp.]|jgi:hypothetical protein|uniref:hypothetical protein n=1 Tax=uncultured Psychrosphaera sp. TaxID=1403522 RepID=UPI00261D5A6A|nr:hypothetical protein [uncultured Psychrosphaera sp.]
MAHAYIRLGWVKARVIEIHKGFSDDALNKMRQTGKIVEGIHWKKVKGVIVYNYEKLDEYFENDGIAA